MTYFINVSDQYVCLYVYPLFVAKQRLGKKKKLLRNEYTCNNRIVGRVNFFAVHIVSRKICD
jgi:hypothetical protein